MHKPHINIYSLFIFFILFCSCEKGKLHFNKVTALYSNTNDRLNALLVKGNTIYAVGGDRFNKATIAISRDGGSTWQAMDFPQAGKALYGIADNGNNKVYACGFDAKLLWSSDNGYNWNFVQMSNWQPFKRMAFVEPNKAIGIMGVSYNSGGRAIVDAAGSILH